MADVFGPFDGLPWAETQWYRFARTWAADGILAAGDLALTTSGLSVTVGTGRAWVGGAGFERTGTPAANAVAANAHATQFRRDRVVLRRSLSGRTVAPVVLQGSPAATPVAPAIAQNETGDWDLPLYSFLVPPASGTTLSGIVDERLPVDSATSAATANRVAKRDAAGRMQVATPSASADVATKGYVDAVENSLQRVAPTDMAVSSGFENWGFGYRDLCYWREGLIVPVIGVVRLLSSMAPQTTRLIGTLPVGFRPSATVVFGSITNARIQVLANGQVRLENDTFGVTLQAGLLVPVNAVVPLG